MKIIKIISSFLLVLTAVFSFNNYSHANNGSIIITSYDNEPVSMINNYTVYEGGTYTIKWNTGVIKSDKVFIMAYGYKDSRLYTVPISSGVTDLGKDGIDTLYNAVPNTGSYTWTVPVAPFSTDLSYPLSSAYF